MPDETPKTNGLGIAWDTNTAAAAIILGAMLFLYLIRRGFRGVVVEL